MTITRVVLSKPKSSYSKEDLENKTKFYQSKWAELDCLESVTAGIDEGNRNQGYSVFAVLTFKDKEALAKYEEAIQPEIVPRLRKTSDDVIIVST